MLKNNTFSKHYLVVNAPLPEKSIFYESFVAYIAFPLPIFKRARMFWGFATYLRSYGEISASWQQ